MKTFQQFLEEVSFGRRVTDRNVIPLDKDAQRELNRSLGGKRGSKPGNAVFRLVPLKTPPK